MFGKYISSKRIALLIILAGLFVVISSGLAVRAESSATIAQGFKVNQEVVEGTLVSITPEAEKSVEVANREHPERLIGVVADKPLVAIDDNESQVQVVTDGLTYALVSDIYGQIKRGDRIEISAIAGVGAKANGSGQIVGIAHGDFSEAKRVKEHTIKDVNGEDRQVKVGLMLVNVGPLYFQQPEDSQTLVPGFLQRFANSLAGRDVVPIRIYVSVAVFLIGLVVIGVLFFSSVRYSITAIGRNPLASGQVQRGLLQVAVIGTMILLVTLIAVYLILII